jgi:hypothetical protein
MSRRDPPDVWRCCLRIQPRMRLVRADVRFRMAEAMVAKSLVQMRLWSHSTAAPRALHAMVARGREEAACTRGQVLLLPAAGQGGTIPGSRLAPQQMTVCCQMQAAAGSIGCDASFQVWCRRSGRSQCVMLLLELWRRVLAMINDTPLFLVRPSCNRQN